MANRLFNSNFILNRIDGVKESNYSDVNPNKIGINTGVINLIKNYFTKRYSHFSPAIILT